jgi:hypothetical protein
MFNIFHFISDIIGSPFTITSAPHESFVSVHIRVVGDWTGDLWNLLNPENKLGIVQVRGLILKFLLQEHH